jgi:hypothetical protein
MGIVTAHGSIPLELLPLKEQQRILAQLGLPIQPARKTRAKKATAKPGAVSMWPPEPRALTPLEIVQLEMAPALDIQEDDWVGKIVRYLTWRGWIWDIKRQDQSAKHVPAGVALEDRDAAGDGSPDILAVRAPRLMFIEAKKRYGRLRVKQNRFRDQLLACPLAEYMVARPQDWEKIKAALW